MKNNAADRGTLPFFVSQNRNNCVLPTTPIYKWKLKLVSLLSPKGMTQSDVNAMNGASDNFLENCHKFRWISLNDQKGHLNTIVMYVLLLNFASSECKHCETINSSIYDKNYHSKQCWATFLLFLKNICNVKRKKEIAPMCYMKYFIFGVSNCYHLLWWIVQLDGIVFGCVWCDCER